MTSAPTRAWDPEEIRTLKDMAVAGAGCEEIALALKRRQADVRDMAELLGVSLEALAKLEWCVLCCSHRKWLDPKTGWCEICTTKLRTEKQRIEADEEEERLREEAERENGMARKERQRMREEFDANPRKGLDA